MADPTSLLGVKRERASRGDIAVHDHVCGIYESHDEEYEPICRYLKIGFERKEQCLYICEETTPALMSARLQAHGVDVPAAIKAGALLLVEGAVVRQTLGGFTPEAMITFLAQSEQKALAAGFTALRLGADMSWLRQDNIEPAMIFIYESLLNTLLFERKIVGFCQYSTVDYKAELLIAAAETHPLLVYTDVVCDNFYYVPPEEYLKPHSADAKLKRILYNIITRERLMQAFLA